MIMYKSQNIKIFLKKAMFQIGQKTFLGLKIFKNTVPWTYVISDLKGEVIGMFYEK